MSDFAASGSSTRFGSVAVIGAGIGGLAVAACLRRIGVEVTIYEQAQQFSRVGAGIQMGPNAMKVLSRLGLRERLASVAYTPPALANREWDTGEVTFSLPMGNRAEETYGAPYFLLHRGDLHEALTTLVPAEIVRLGRRLTTIRELADGVALEFHDGTQTTVDAVIAADGVHSIVRQQMFSADDAIFTKRVAYRTVFPASLMNGDLPDAASTKWWGPDRHIVIYFVSAGREIYFTTSVPDEDWTTESWSAEGDVEELREAFAGFHPEVRNVLQACPSVHKWAIYDRDPLASWHTDRVALLGDACHPMTPYMAQGAATALEDAVVLSRFIEQLGFERLGEAFAAYEATRKPRTSRIQGESRSNSWLRRPQDTHWVYDYDAWAVGLPTPETVAAE